MTLVFDPCPEWRQLSVVVAGTCSLRPRPLCSSCLATGTDCSIKYLPAALFYDMFGNNKTCVTSCSIGAVPPFGFLPGEGHEAGVRVLIDESVRDLGGNFLVLVGGGMAETVLKITVDCLMHVVDCENATGGVIDTGLIYDLCRSAPPPSSSSSDAPLPIPLDSTSAMHAAPPLRLACDSSLARAGGQLPCICELTQP